MFPAFKIIAVKFDIGTLRFTRKAAGKKLQRAGASWTAVVLYRFPTAGPNLWKLLFCHGSPF
jgi:hypothetical protein